MEDNAERSYFELLTPRIFALNSQTLTCNLCIALILKRFFFSEACVLTVYLSQFYMVLVNADKKNFSMGFVYRVL